jgi:hypothetical protein
VVALGHDASGRAWNPRRQFYDMGIMYMY